MMHGPKSMFAVVLSLLASMVSLAQQPNSRNMASGTSVPRLVKFSGALLGRKGEVSHGATTRLTFAVYEEQAGGVPLWSEVQDVRLDAQGRYAVLLGAASGDGLPTELFSTGGARWLGVQTEGGEEQPRVLLVAVPYALKAADADRLGGRPAAAFVATDQLKEQVRTELSSQVSSGKVGGRTFNALIGTTSPQAGLTSPTSGAAITSGASSFSCGTTTPCVTVSQSSTGAGIQSSAKTLGVYGVASQTTGTTYGVRGQTPSTTGRGVLGYATATSGGTIGVYGLVPSTAGVGVLGEAAAATGATRGVIGHTPSTTGIGVWGYDNAASGSTTGVRGDVWSVSGIAGVFDNRAGGKILSGRVNGSEKFSVGGSGNVTAAGSITAPSFVGNSALISGLVSASSTTTALGSGVLSVTQSGSTATPQEDTSTLSPSAIVGSATATTGFANGIVGSTTSDGGVGVLGANLSGSSGAGVVGATTSTAAGGNGQGVMAVSLAATGEATALEAEVNSPDGIAGLFHSNAAGAALILGEGPAGPVFGVNTNGNVTTNTGDFRDRAPGKGLILKSPDGNTCARISIDNAGAIVSTVVTCP